MDDQLIYICEICQTVLQEHHCKAQCPNCGRMFDCSDLPLIPANGVIDGDDGAYVARPGSNPLDLLPQARPIPPVPAKPAGDDEKAKVANLP